MKGYWLQYDYSVHHSFKCAHQGTIVALSKLSGSCSVITDFYSIMLPAVLLLRIKITTRQRWGLMFIFGMGYL
jgi:hypothetical protein